ncbi:MAG: hypothetical protein HC866_11575 [Leptolyngbyaceae cyanobacterium RU_5_1]|nr:hypothetical protein [Leptolyngbyaceae cyanobacterium RU_5_1]
MGARLRVFLNTAEDRTLFELRSATTVSNVNYPDRFATIILTAFCHQKESAVELTVDDSSLPEFRG